MQKRMTAIRVTIADVIHGNFIKDSTGSYVISPYGIQIRRAAFVGFTIRTYSKPGEFASITLDDGTETIQAKAWGRERHKVDLLSEVAANKLVLLIGRVKQYNNEVYVDPEIIREVTDPNFMTYHLLVRYQTILSQVGVYTPVGQVSEPTEPIVEEPSASDAEEYSGPLMRQILRFVKKHGATKGVAIDEIIEFFMNKGYEKDDIQMKVLDLQEREEIEEVGIGKYVALN